MSKTKIAFFCSLLAATVPVVALGQEQSKAATSGTVKVQITQCALKVSGMTCRGCAPMVEKGLLKLEGVNTAKVDFKSGEAQVEFDTNKATPERIVAAFNQANSGLRVEQSKTRSKESTL